MKYDFYVTTYQKGGKEKGDTQTDVNTVGQTNLTIQTVIPMGIETTHPIGLGFIWRTIQSDF